MSLSLETMRRAVADALGERPEEIGDDDDLIRLGIDSIRIMRLANLWRREGVPIKFAELIEKPAIGAWWALASERLAGPAPVATPAVIDEAAPFPLAPMQQAYWIGRGENQVLGGVSAHFYAEFDGEGVEPVRLERAVRTLLVRHGMLRARFLGDGSQQILPRSGWPGVAVHDLRDGDPGAALARLRGRLSHRRLDVEHGEVFDVRLSLLPKGATRTHVNIDMLVSDAQSYQIILEELAQLYLHPEAPLPPLSYSFPRYLAEQAQRRRDANETARAYWRERLEEMPGAPQLPLAIEPERLTRVGVNRRFQWLTAAERRALAERANQHGLTLPVVMATAFAEVLAAWSAEPRFLLNLPLFDREEPHPDAPRLVGDFTNLIVLAVDCSGSEPFLTRARRLQSRLRADVSHAEYSGVEVLRDLARARPGDWMMAPVVFTSAIGMGELFSAAVRQCLGTPGWTTSETPQVWIDQQVTEHDGGLLINWDVIEELFPDGVLDGMFDAYLTLLRNTEWDGPLPDLRPTAQAEVRARVNATGRPHAERLLHEGFFAWAARDPERMALACEHDAIGYGALAEQALRVAAWLRSGGLTDGDTVAVTMPRGPAQIAAVLGVLAAGGVYVPVGVDQPFQRRERIYADARVKQVLSGEIPSGPALAEPVRLLPDALAYVVYTSGSTGEPKGVEITHRAVMNTVDEINARFGVGARDRVLAVSALDFDLSVYDIFGPLSVGGAAVLAEEEQRREARRWAELIRRWDVTVWNSVPALLDMLLVATSGDGLPPSLRLALVSGDWVGLDLPERLAKECRLVALGGATEASIWSNAFEVTGVEPGWRSIPYGYPLRGQAYRAVDARERDCPDWVPGELWIGGAGVANGYRGDPERTAERFVTRDGERWYRTGDIGRYWPDGTLEFLGRADHQVKIRGHRIELGEIEAALAAHPAVTRAVAFVTGRGRIKAGVVARGAGLDGLRRFTAERLPAYMVPDGLAILDELPLNANGKIDRDALAGQIDRFAAQAAGELPHGPVETELAGLWADLLAVPAVGRGSSFFALGGDSLLATRMVEEVRQRFGVEVTLRRLFTAPTVAELATFLLEMEEGVI